MTPINLVVVETRDREYPNRPKANKVRTGRKTNQVNDPGGTGTEIVKEVALCPECAKAVEDREALQQAAEAA